MPLTEIVCCVTVTFTNLSTFNVDFKFGEKPEVAGSPIWGAGGLTDLGDALLCQTSLNDSCGMGRGIVVM